MATRTWTGAASNGDFSDVLNWSTGVVPVTGDSVIVSDTATYGMTTNLNRSADGAGAGLNVVSFEIEKGFQYNIGSATAPLRLTADTFTDYGNGETYFSTDTGTAALNTDRVIIDKDDISKAVYLIGSFAGGADSHMTLIEVVQGANVFVGDGTIGQDVTTLWLAPRFSASDVKVTGNISTTCTTVHLAGGMFVVNAMEVTTLNMGGGTLDFRKTTIPLLNQFGGIVLHNGEESNYAITTYNAAGGFMDSRETPGTKLITTLNRGPAWDKAYNPKDNILTTNYIGG